MAKQNHQRRAIGAERRGRTGTATPHRVTTDYDRPIHTVVRWLLVVFVFCCLIAVRQPASARSNDSATSSRAAREEAIQVIPFQRLKPEAQQKIAAIVSKPSVYRRLPVKIIDCDPTLYLFLVRNPEVIVNIWDLMGVTEIQLERNGPFSYKATDGVGTASDVELVYGTPELHLLYGEGDYEGPLMPKPVHGRCVALLRSTYNNTADRGVQVTNQLDVFLQLDHVAVDALAKTFHPLFWRTADMNFVQTTSFLERVSRTAERNGPGVERLSTRLNKVDPQIRQQFAELALAISGAQTAQRPRAIPETVSPNR
jgi:hypothetical protein